MTLKSFQQANTFITTEVLSDSHVVFVGIDGALQNSIIEADGIARWKGIKGKGRSSFWAAGRRMRSWHSGGVGTVLTMMFNSGATERLLHDARATEWCSRASTDHAFIAASGFELANALQGEDDGLTALHAQTVATSLHLYSVRRFSRRGASWSDSGNAVDRAIELIQASLPNTVSLDELVAVSGLARGQFLQAFRARTKQSPHQYIIHERLCRAKSLLLSTDRCLAEIARDVGCANAEHMGRMFRQHLDMSPRAWRVRNGRR